ncbi:MAG: CheR family methyltransferase [Pedobacter sp.]
MNERFEVYAATSPTPLPAPRLIVTQEIRYQSELYLPVADIARNFQRLYRSALTYPPILSSAPFHNLLSWADLFTILLPRFQVSANPARLLELLLSDHELLVEFIFASFLPNRFYGGFRRYPQQGEIIREWLKVRRRIPLRCLDAACGAGEETYGLTNLLMERGLQAEDIQIEGWTIEPLEVWAAAYARFPHDRLREVIFRKETSEVFEQGFHTCIRFRSIDLFDAPRMEQFDLILCNGLLGGPIINTPHRLEQVVGNLARLLASGGLLLAADHFHGGWKQKCPQENLWALLEQNSLKTFEAGEGVGGLKSYQ